MGTATRTGTVIGTGASIDTGTGTGIGTGTCIAMGTAMDTGMGGYLKAVNPIARTRAANRPKIGLHQ